MKNKDIERMLAYDLSEQRPEEDAWRRVAFGELDADALVAERWGVEPEDELERKRVLFTPRSEDAQARMRESLRERFYSSSPRHDLAAYGDSDVTPPVKLRPRSRRTRTTTAAWGVMLAAAAALVLVWVIERPEPSTRSEPLEVYEIYLTNPWSGGMRSASAGADDPRRCKETYHRDRSISVQLHPQTATREKVAVATLARSNVGESTWWPAASPEQGVDGVLTIRREVAELGLSPGIWTLTFFITRAGEPLDPGTLKALPPGAHPGVTVVRTTVCIEG